MSRRDDLEQLIHSAYGIVRDYEQMLPVETRPEERRRAQQRMAEQWASIRDYLQEYRRIWPPASWPPEIREIAAHWDDFLPAPGADSQPAAAARRADSQPAATERRADSQPATERGADSQPATERRAGFQPAAAERKTRGGAKRKTGERQAPPGAGQKKPIASPISAPPETALPGRTAIDPEACIACGLCADVCPVEAIREGEDTFVIDSDLCIDCGACEAECPVDAIYTA